MPRAVLGAAVLRPDWNAPVGQVFVCRREHRLPWRHAAAQVARAAGQLGSALRAGDAPCPYLDTWLRTKARRRRAPYGQL
jgi:hypothetical protein